MRPPPSAGALSSSACDSLCPSAHPLTVPCLAPGRPEAHSLASASPPRVCVASAARPPLLATPVALALPLTPLLVELKAQITFSIWRVPLPQKLLGLMPMWLSSLPCSIYLPASFCSRLLLFFAHSFFLCGRGRFHPWRESLPPPPPAFWFSLFLPHPRPPTCLQTPGLCQAPGVPTISTMGFTSLFSASALASLPLPPS